jgi:hypothetical protein
LPQISALAVRHAETSPEAGAASTCAANGVVLVIDGYALAWVEPV